MGRKRNKKGKVQIVEFNVRPDRTLPTREPRLIPKSLLWGISEYVLQTPATYRNVFLSVTQYPMNIMNLGFVATDHSPTHILIFCVRLLNQQFNPLGTVLINIKEAGLAEKLALLWQAFLQDLSILRLVVIGSISPPWPLFHDILSILTENSKLEEHTGPITYTVWPYSNILHIYDCNELGNCLQEALRERVDMYFVTRSPSSERTLHSDIPRDLKLYSASWTDILLTFTTAGIKCIYTTDDEKDVDTSGSIFSNVFKKAYKKLSKKGLIATDTKTSTDRLFQLIYPFIKITKEEEVLHRDFLQTLYNDFEELRILLATARFRGADISEQEPKSVISLNSAVETSENTSSSIELGDDHIKNIITCIETYLEPDVEEKTANILQNRQTPFDVFLQNFAYDDYDLFIKRSLADQATEAKREESEAIARTIERAIAHDHDYFKREEPESPPLEAQPQSGIAGTIKTYFNTDIGVDDSRSNQSFIERITEEVPESKRPDFANRFFPSNMHNCYGKVSDVEIRNFEKQMRLLTREPSEDVFEKSRPKRWKSSRKSNRISPAPQVDGTFDATKVLGRQSDYENDSVFGHTHVKTAIPSPTIIDLHETEENKPETFVQKQENMRFYFQKSLEDPSLNLTKEKTKETDEFGNKPYSRAINSLDLANLNNSIVSSLTNSVIMKAFRDFSNILDSYGNALDLLIDTGSKDSLTDLFSTIDNYDDRRQVKPPSKYLIPKSTKSCFSPTDVSTSYSRNAKRSKIGRSTSSCSDSELFIKNNLLKLQKTYDEATWKDDGGVLESNLPAEKVGSVVGSVDFPKDVFLSESGKFPPSNKENNDSKRDDQKSIEESPLLAACCAGPSTSTACHDNDHPDHHCQPQGKLSPYSNRSSSSATVSVPESYTATHIDYVEHGKKIISTLCDNKAFNCDNNFRAVNTIPIDSEPSRPRSTSSSTFSVPESAYNFQEAETDYVEYGNKLISALCDNKVLNGDNNFRDKDYYNDAFNGIPRGSEPLRPISSSSGTISLPEGCAIAWDNPEAGAVTEMDYDEYRKKLISTLCDNKEISYDNILKHKDYYNKLFNLLPGDLDQLRDNSSDKTDNPSPDKSNAQETDDVTEIDYREYKRQLLSTLCDNKELDCDNIFKDKDYFNKLLNSIPGDFKPLRATTDILCTIKGFLKLNEILERRKVKHLTAKLLCLEHIDFYMSMINKLKSDNMSSSYTGPSYKLLDYRYMLSPLDPNQGLYII